MIENDVCARCGAVPEEETVYCNGCEKDIYGLNETGPVKELFYLIFIVVAFIAGLFLFL